MTYVSIIRDFPEEGGVVALLMSDEKGKAYWSTNGRTFENNLTIDFVVKADRYKNADAREKHQWLRRAFVNTSTMTEAREYPEKPQEILDTIGDNIDTSLPS